MYHSSDSLRSALLRAASVAIVALVIMPSAANAIPMFARRTGMACSACHETWPRLNDFGELYRDNGYQLPGRRDTDPTSSDYFPISARPAIIYQYLQTTNQRSDNGPITVGSGSVQYPSTDLLLGGPIVDNIAALLVVSGFGSSGLGAVESAWLRLSNIAGSQWLNVRAGLVELDMPASEHRSLTLTQPYAIFHYQPSGSINTFSMGDNQLGVELMGHSQGVGLRYSLSVATASGNLGSSAVWSSPTAYAHVTETWHPFASGLTRVRIGAVGYAGMYPTHYATITPAGGTPMQVSNTGTDHKAFVQGGGEVGITLGPLVHPLTFQVVGMYGHQDGALVANATRDVDYLGGYAEMAFVPILRLAVFGRYDFVRSLRNGDPTQPGNVGDIDGFVLGGRWTLIQSWNAAVMLHAEASWLLTQGAGANGTSTQQTIFAAGFDVVL